MVFAGDYAIETGACGLTIPPKSGKTMPDTGRLRRGVEEAVRWALSHRVRHLQERSAREVSAAGRAAAR